MATPNLDKLHILFSRAVEDTITNAATDGVQFTVANREDYINRAINSMVLDVYASSGRERVRDIFQEMLVPSVIISFSSAGTSLDVDSNGIVKMLLPISLIKIGSDSVFVYHSRMEDLFTQTNPNLKEAYIIQADKLYATENGSFLNSGIGGFIYIEKAAGVQGTTDVKVNPGLFDGVVDYAATLAFEETGELQSAQARAGRIQALISALKGK